MNSVINKKTLIIVIYIVVFIVLYLLINSVFNSYIITPEFKNIFGPRFTVIIYIFPVIATYYIMPEITKLNSLKGDEYQLKWKFIKNKFLI